MNDVAYDILHHNLLQAFPLDLLAAQRLTTEKWIEVEQGM
jgi:hypothetical protein